MEFRQIRYALAVAKERSFTKAAGRLRISQSAVSEQMNLSDVARRLSGVGVEALIVGIGSGLAPVLLPRMFPPGSFPANLHLEIKTAPTRVIFDDLYDDRLDLGVVTE